VACVLLVRDVWRALNRALILTAFVFPLLAATHVTPDLAPASDLTVVLDFNRATNLPCAYTELATCPLPPAENHLPVAVEAGERIPYEAGA